MAQRKRKRERTAPATATATTPPPESPRSQKRAGSVTSTGKGRSRREPVTNKEWMERYAERGEARNAEARAKLVPLAPGERPWPILVGVVICTAAAVLNLVLWAAGAKIGGKPPSAFEMMAFATVMIICAVGMWVLWYQAVLAFMVLLGIVILLFALLLVEVSNVRGFILAIAVVGGGGYEFWKLVRVLGRLQMPSRPTRSAHR